MIVQELFAKLGLDLDESSFAAAQAAMGGLKKGMIGLGLALGGVAVGFAAAIKRTADAGDHIDELAQQVGVNAQELQRMAYGAQFSSVSVDDLAQAMGFLAKKGVKDLRGGMLQIADQFQKLPDGGAKAKFAMEKFGRAGKAMIPFLNEGREKLAQWAKEADETGYVMGTQLVADSAAFNDSIDRLGSSLTGLRNTVIGPLLAPVREVVNALRDWVVANRVMIAQGIGAVFKALAGALKVVWFFLKPIVKALGWLVSNTTRVRVAMHLLAAALLYRMVPALLANNALMGALTALTTAWGRAALIAGARAALAPIIAAAPWILLIGILGLIIEDIYVALTGGRSFFAEWTRFLKEDPGDSAFMRELKRELRMLTDIQGTLLQIIKLKDQLFAVLGKSFTYALKTGDVKGGLAYAAANAMQAFRTATTALDPTGFRDPGFISPPSVGVPSALSPQTSVRVPQSSVASFQVGEVNVSVPSGDPQVVKSAVIGAFEDMWKTKMNTARSGGQ